MAIQHRRGTAAAATAANVVGAEGQLGVETDTGRIKVFDGVTAWNALRYTGSDVGGGTETGFYTTGAAAPAQIEKVRHGTTAAPVTTLGPTVKVSRTEQFTRAAVEAVAGAGADGVDLCSALVGMNTATANSEVQAVGVFGAAKTSSTYEPGSGNDACGLYGAGRATAGDGVGIGGFVIGRRDADTARVTGFEVHCANYGATAGAWNSAGFQTTQGVWLNCSGNADSAAAVVVSNAFGRRFDVGLGFTGQVAGGLTGGVKTASIRDDSQSATSLLINGTHATAAIAVAAGAGNVGFGLVSNITGKVHIVNDTPGQTSLKILNAASQTFYSLAVADSTGATDLFHVASTGVVRSAGGSVANPNLAHPLDTDTGMYRAGSDQWAVSTGGVARASWSNSGVQIGSATAAFGGGVGVVGLTNATTAPTTNPAGGGVMYAEAGALKWRGSAGTVTTLAAA